MAAAAGEAAATQHDECERDGGASGHPIVLARRPVTSNSLYLCGAAVRDPAASCRRSCEASVNSRNSPLTRKAVCSPMSTAWSPIRSRQRETMIMRRPHSRRSGSLAEREHVPDDPAVGAVDQLVEVDERLGPASALRSRKESSATRVISSARCAHLLEALEDRLVVRDDLHELRQLGDRHAVVGHALEVEVVVEDREHEAQVDGDRRLAGEERLDALLDREVGGVDLVVEGDHLVGQLDVGLQERVQAPRSARRTSAPSSCSAASSWSSSSWSVTLIRIAP